jgi:hypothetical protein
MLRWCDSHTQHSFWLMLTTTADSLTPNSPQGVGVAKRRSVRLRIFQESNPAAGERSLYYGVTNCVIHSTPMPQCVIHSTPMPQCRVSLCLRPRLKRHQEIYIDGIYRSTSYHLRLRINLSSLIYLQSFYTFLTTGGLRVLQMFQTS